jgi:hypothetical protein
VLLDQENCRWPFERVGTAVHRLYLLDIDGAATGDGRPKETGYGLVVGHGNSSEFVWQTNKGRS